MCSSLKHQIALESIKHSILFFQNGVNTGKTKSTDFYLMTMLIINELSRYEEVNLISQNEHDEIFNDFVNSVRGYGKTKKLDFDFKNIDHFLEIIKKEK